MSNHSPLSFLQTDTVGLRQYTRMPDGTETYYVGRPIRERQIEILEGRITVRDRGTEEPLTLMPQEGGFSSDFFYGSNGEQYTPAEVGNMTGLQFAGTTPIGFTPEATRLTSNSISMQTSPEEIVQAYQFTSEAYKTADRLVRNFTYEGQHGNDGPRLVSSTLSKRTADGWEDQPIDYSNGYNSETRVSERTTTYSFHYPDGTKRRTILSQRLHDPQLGYTLHDYTIEVSGQPELKIACDPETKSFSAIISSRVPGWFSNTPITREQAEKITGLKLNDKGLPVGLETSAGTPTD